MNNPGGKTSLFGDWKRRNGAPIACLVAELQWINAYFYLLEKERAPKEFSPLLIAWHQDRRPSTDDALAGLLQQRAGARTWPKTHGDWVLVHLPHGYNADDTFVAGIYEHLGPLPERPGPVGDHAATPSPDETPNGRVRSGTDPQA